MNDNEKTMLIAEVKRRSQKIDINKLKSKSEKLVSKHKKYKISYLGYSLEDM